MLKIWSDRNQRRISDKSKRGGGRGGGTVEWLSRKSRQFNKGRVWEAQLHRYRGVYCKLLYALPAVIAGQLCISINRILKWPYLYSSSSSLMLLNQVQNFFFKEFTCFFTRGWHHLIKCALYMTESLACILLFCMKLRLRSVTRIFGLFPL
jgi:hypothetical protein